jgi:hypothetical protein
MAGCYLRGRVHSGLVCRPVLDAQPSTIVVAWPRQSRSQQVVAFVRAATDAAARRKPFSGSPAHA